MTIRQSLPRMAQKIGRDGAPARETDHGACRDWRSKTKRTQARLGKFIFFESHIRATNAPACSIMSILSKTTMLTRYSAALRLPLYSATLRLPTLGYTFCLSLWTCAIARVFAPAELIRRISRPAPPSELPCGSLSRPSPKVSIRFGPTFGCSILRLPRRSIV
jgi:hypothetical protein